MTCQQMCDTEDGCISYGYDTNAKEGNCAMSYQWVAGAVTPGKTGVWFSDGTRKTGYKCFDDRPFGT